LGRFTQINFYAVRAELGYSQLVALSKNSGRALHDNAFLVNLELKCKELYNNLPENALILLLIKELSYRSLPEVLQILYDLNSDKDIQNIFTIPDKLDIPGIYCFMSKDRSNLFYYRVFS
jgi:hypothetical protein